MKQTMRDFKIRHAYEAVPARIVSDGMIATAGVGEGRMVPLLILDEETRPDIGEMLRVYEHLPVGDHAAQWGQIPSHEGTIALFLEFKRPTQTIVVLEFDIEEQGGIVDAIIRARAVYLQGGREGDRLSTTLNTKRRILVEIGDLGIDQEWDKRLRKHLVKKFRRDGMGRSEAKRAVERFLNTWRQMTGVRMRR